MTSLHTIATSRRSMLDPEWIKLDVGTNESADVFHIDSRELIISVRRDVAPAGSLEWVNKVLTSDQDYRATFAGIIRYEMNQ